MIDTNLLVGKVFGNKIAEYETFMTDSQGLFEPVCPWNQAWLPTTISQPSEAKFSLQMARNGGICFGLTSIFLRGCLNSRFNFSVQLCDNTALTLELATKLQSRYISAGERSYLNDGNIRQENLTHSGWLSNLKGTRHTRCTSFITRECQSESRKRTIEISQHRFGNYNSAHSQFYKSFYLTPNNVPESPYSNQTPIEVEDLVFDQYNYNLLGYNISKHADKDRYISKEHSFFKQFCTQKIDHSKQKNIDMTGHLLTPETRNLAVAEMIIKARERSPDSDMLIGLSWKSFMGGHIAGLYLPSLSNRYDRGIFFDCNFGLYLLRGLDSAAPDDTTIRKLITNWAIYSPRKGANFQILAYPTNPRINHSIRNSRPRNPSQTNSFRLNSTSQQNVRKKKSCC